MTNFCY